jgi:WD40 repeat protein/serine/threonine protein kinase
MGKACITAKASFPMTEESIFSAALQKFDPAERAAFLNQACEGNAPLRARVEALLGSHEAAGSFLVEPAVGQAATLAPDPDAAAPTLPPPSGEAPGTRIGPYKLLQQIGEGGMGTVWMAEQTVPVRRTVALKVVKAGLDSAQVVVRFEAERQALALMDHPHIARVLDAGSTESGRPYFVMELVKGVPITKYCDAQRLTLRQRLELFIPVCQALQHAHQKGIIHRDIKPSNVLIAPYDGQPVVKVIDFGVAKATGQRLTEKTMFTEFGAVIGTLEYMSPEQAELNNQDIDTRSDIYSLGVLLYELLTGSTPLDMQRLRGAAFAAILMQIQEQEPPRPSTRLSESQETLALISAQRQTEPARLAKLVRGELDWIVMKALEKERGRRYDTASGLARDIEHHLREEPVEAGRPGAVYRLRKLLRRNRGAVSAAVLVLLALVGGTVAAIWGLVHAQRALAAEAEQRRQAEHARDEEGKALTAAEAERVAAARARDAAERALYFNRINLAYQYWLGNHLDQSSRILNLCPSAARGWEWRYLNQLHHADLLTLAGNGQFTTNLQFSKDGKRLAAFARSGDAGVRVWDLQTNKPLAEISLSRNQRAFTCSALSADGKTIALGDTTGAVTLWQADTGKPVRPFARVPKAVTSLSFSPDGRWLAAARVDGRNGEMLFPLAEPPRNEELIVWDVASGKEAFHPKGYGLGAEFSPDGSRLLTFRKNTALRLSPGTPEFFVALFNTATWTEVAPGQLGSGGSFSFSGDGKRLALGGTDRQRNVQFLRIVDPATGAELSAFAPAAVGDIALNTDGTILALSGAFGSTQIEIWDVNNRRRSGSLRGHSQAINAVAFAPDGRLASCAWDNTIKFWDTKGCQDVVQVTRPRVDLAIPAALGPAGAVLAYGQVNTVNLFTGPVRTVTLVDAGTGRVTHTLAGHSDGAQALAFSSNGARLASGGRKGDVKVWDVSGGALLCTIPGHGEWVAGLALSSDGRLVAATREPREITEARFGRGQFKQIPVAVKVFNAETGQERLTLSGHPSTIEQVAFSPNGKLLASAGYRLVKIWDLTTGAWLRDLNQSEFQSGTDDALVFSKSGNLLATAGSQTVQIWDVASGRSLALFQGHAFLKLNGVAISPDETRLATGGAREVKLWDIASGQEILTLPLPPPSTQEQPGSIGSLAWSADGRRLRAALSNGAIIEWSTAGTGGLALGSHLGSHASVRPRLSKGY